MSAIAAGFTSTTASKRSAGRSTLPVWITRSFSGDGGDAELARHIADSHGPSGSNAEYLLRLAASLRELGEHDEHVTSLERELLRLRPELAADGYQGTPV
jgi:cation transport regulator ChaC